ncbi:NADH-dependent [FeFe] hydrogenase, group A6 [Paenibacillus wynnii]|uniref:NADH-dependent [FeFe] hydrogenase, group A6 n=1 Tax=Paenibacillus wynnii TaxID=268407 RepID=UPI00279187F4|nr:NADH-dependent [FeFe] hydrogenase, group A6 [Paenibacillus wynnii]MDQ0195301.1 NADH-quinone oxidoreductase subunit G/NADP-reducing hydrogenase subunit HndD [Paenibacillus wynnii]
MLNTINIMIDGIETKVAKGTTVLEAARDLDIHIPSLCYLKGVNHSSSCRVCVVEVGPRLIASCTLKAEEGMKIQTNTKKVREARKTSVELLLSDHDRECLSCSRSGGCELQTVSNDLNIRTVTYVGEKSSQEKDYTSPSIFRDASKCILCGRCVGACGTMQTVGAINFAKRGFDTVISTAFGRPLEESTCVNCGQCIMACPVGALTEHENINDVWNALENASKYVVVQTAPAVRVALGEEFGLPVGTRVTGKMVAALRKLGFDKVFDTNFGADLTIMEEGTELISRITSGQNLPLMTSCCPGWVKFMEHNFPDRLDNLSTCKSPHEMEGAMVKSYFAKKMGIDPKNIVVVSIMPCTAKKFEGSREELSNESMQDVDWVLTTRELAAMIKEAGIDFVNLKGETFDSPIGEGSGAAVIFGATGGVAEAALRTVFEITSGKDLETIEYTAVRGMDGIKENVIELPNGQKIRTAVVHGLGNARKLMEAMERGEKAYEFIEVMACVGGCITGGGQPIVDARTSERIDIKAERAKAIYTEDEAQTVRKSHKNPYITALYEEFLGTPNSHLAHELLHTHYVKRSKF